MSLHEADILDRLRQSTKEAIDHCKTISVSWERGEAYSKLRDNLHEIDGCCRQMAMWRGDYRWLPFGVFAANMHQRAGDWLRGYVDDGVMVLYSPGTLNKAFVKLAAELGVILEGLETLVTMKSGLLGAVLPPKPSEERRSGRPGFVHKTKKPALIIPAKYRTV